MGFKRWHSTTFDAQEEPNSVRAIGQKLNGITGGVDGVDAAATESCFRNDAKSVANGVADEQAGKREGVTVTSTFVFDDPTSTDTPTTGEIARPYPLFESTVEGAER